MANFTGPNRAWDAGVPEQWSDNFLVTAEGLITGETPRQFVEDMTAALNQTIAAYTAVGLNAQGDIVPAVNGTTQAIGILVYPVVAGATNKPVARVLRAGCLNPAMIAWPASYDTDEKKLEAFRGAPTPTQIVVRGLSSYTPVLP